MLKCYETSRKIENSFSLKGKKIPAQTQKFINSAKKAEINMKNLMGPRVRGMNKSQNLGRI